MNLPAGEQRPFVTIAMPALNEERYVERAIKSLIPVSNTIDYEILVLDGGSTDATPQIVQQLSQRYPAIRLVANERRIQSAAINKAARICDPRSVYLVRADCHADYPAGFVEACIAALEQTGAVSVVVPMKTVGKTCLQKAVAAAQNSRLGNGGSAHRMSSRSQFVDHGHHAAFRRRAFESLGGYDENFTHNEDAEFDVRLRRSGGQIWLASEAAIKYYPRSTLRSLARQYYKHGYGRASTLLKHRLTPKLRQILPLAAVALGILGLLLATLDPLFLLVPVSYVSGALLIGAALAVKTDEPCAAASGLAALVMHSSWAVGFAARLIAHRRKMSKRFVTVPDQQ